MSNIELTNIKEFEINYSRYSKFCNLDNSDKSIFDIKEAQLIGEGIDLNNVYIPKNKYNNMFKENNIKYQLTNTNEIFNNSSSIIYVSVCGGNIFKILPDNILGHNSLEEEYVEVTGTYFLKDSRDQILEDISEIDTMKPMQVKTKIDINELRNSAYLIPELNIIISQNKQYIVEILKSQNIEDKYRTEGKKLHFNTIDKSNIYTEKSIFDYLADNISIGYNIIINDPDGDLTKNIYYTYLNDTILPIFVQKNKLLKKGVYFIFPGSDKNNDKLINVSEISLSDFREEINKGYVVYNKNDYNYVIGLSKASIKIYIDDHGLSKTENLSQSIIEYKNTINSLKKENEKLALLIKEKDQEIALLNERIKILDKRVISDNHVSRASYSSGKSYTEYKNSNIKFYTATIVGVLGVVGSVVAYMKKTS